MRLRRMGSIPRLPHFSFALPHHRLTHLGSSKVLLLIPELLDILIRQNLQAFSKRFTHQERKSPRRNPQPVWDLANRLDLRLLRGHVLIEVS